MTRTISVETLARARPRTPLAVLPTPLVAAPRLAEALGTGPLLIKRDDLTGFAFGGNKVRLLEFLVAAATADGADTLLTGGAAGSNFCAAAAAVARRAGLGCQLVIAGLAGPPGPALALARAWGATVRWTGVPERDSVDAALPAVARELAAARQVLTLARDCLRLLGAGTEAGTEPGPADVTVVDARGPGHGLPSPDGLAAAGQAMRTEGLMLDPVYTAKALAHTPKAGPVVFWHTGGVLDVVAAAQEAEL